MYTYAMVELSGSRKKLLIIGLDFVTHHRKYSQITFSRWKEDTPDPKRVCRPRDKIHRPQTRRRRENNEESLDKMRTLRTNLVKAYEVHEWLVRREAQKYSLVVCTYGPKLAQE